MTVRTILTAVTDEALLDSTLDHAAALAAGCDAHLEVLGLGVDRALTGSYYAGASAVVIEETLSRAHAEAEALGAAARRALARHALRWSVDHHVALLGDIGAHLAARARFADLVVLPQPCGKGRAPELEPLVEGALFQAQTPVMVVPDAVAPTVPPERVVIAWNESAEAMRAVRAALPLMAQARSVTVVVIDPPQHAPNRSDPGGALSQFLSRHGLRVEIEVLSRTLPRISDVLLRHVAESGADLVIMGAYGHSRFREAILGGATRAMLEQQQVAVLMAR